jgi:large subunit ribosomal protein L31
MKQNIHPKYFEKAKVSCACGNKFEVGATVPEISVDVCSACHPFYTGSQKYIDTAGRVDKFMARMAKAKDMQGSKKPKSKAEVKEAKEEKAEK